MNPMHTRYTESVFVLAMLLALVSVPATALAQNQNETLERGRALIEAFYAGDLGFIVEVFTDEMKKAIPGTSELGDFRSSIRETFGEEAEVEDEQVRSVAGGTIYERTVRFENAPDSPMTIVWAFDSEGLVAGFSIQPAGVGPSEAATPHLDYETRAQLRLPFQGEWTVFWGGRSVSENYHAAHLDQRFAYDLVVVDSGRTFSGEGRSNGEYHCFRRPILAPAPGTVVHAVDGVADNEPGEMNPSQVAGNHVVLDLGEEEFAFLAHLREGSVRVSEGDTVESGETLGECGNSGNSSEPHLHFHLQNTPDFGRGEGLPAFFHDYEADGRRIRRGEPVQGERIRGG